MALRKGSLVPHFTAIDSQGEQFDSALVFGKQWVVLFFYPKDDTPGCTTQACAFRDRYQDFTDLGAVVIGVSSDGVASHVRFQSKYKLPFTLLADTQKKIRTLFGVPKDLMGLVDGRATYVIGLDQKIHYIFDSISGSGHMERALAFLKSKV
ncbi:peroxiredoxin [Flavobacterium sp.]|jgi:peroxiredoxin Q/BCP|uniref:peroxiredoxin n=1 Tax=Flavobacterium sp. TaxID=239 RepID=UPI0022C6F6E0|nr:peroxiredoxin [Flavobacterium sp.]MCZ8144066.1 peroxiredoxin [Flavobacterium sp.]MCZ8366313.1 peroxiredoxin [Flavobacterium sp.]